MRSVLVIAGVGRGVLHLALWMGGVNLSALPLCPSHGPLFVKAAPLFYQFTNLTVKNIYSILLLNPMARQASNYLSKYVIINQRCTSLYSEKKRKEVGVVENGPRGSVTIYRLMHF